MKQKIKLGLSTCIPALGGELSQDITRIACKSMIVHRKKIWSELHRVVSRELEDIAYYAGLSPITPAENRYYAIKYLIQNYKQMPAYRSSILPLPLQLGYILLRIQMLIERYFARDSKQYTILMDGHNNLMKSVGLQLFDSPIKLSILCSLAPLRAFPVELLTVTVSYTRLSLDNAYVCDEEEDQVMNNLLTIKEFQPIINIDFN